MVPRVMFLFAIIFFLPDKGVRKAAGRGLFYQFDSFKPEKLIQEFVVGKIKEYQKTGSGEAKKKILGMICPNCHKCPIDMCKNFCTKKCKEYEEKSKETNSENTQTPEDDKNPDEESSKSEFELGDVIKKMTKLFYGSDGADDGELESNSNPAPQTDDFMKNDPFQKLERMFYLGKYVPPFEGLESHDSETKEDDKDSDKDVRKESRWSENPDIQVPSQETGSSDKYLSDFEEFIKLLLGNNKDKNKEKENCSEEDSFM